MLNRKLAVVALAVVAFVSVGIPANAATAPSRTSTPANADTPAATTITYLFRYASPAGHRVTTDFVATNGYFTERGGLWGIFQTKIADTRALYECRAGGGDYFVSLQSNCEGHSRLSTLGYIKMRKGNGASTLLYRCYVPGVGDHFVSIRKDCEGQQTDGAIGYARSPNPWVAFSRYNNGPDHWETSHSTTSTYFREGTWFISFVERAGTAPIYSCRYRIGDRWDHFVSRQSDCEGKTKVKTEGYVYTYDAGSVFTELYRCLLPSGDHFSSTSVNCENARGVVNEGTLGWVRTRVW